MRTAGRRCPSRLLIGLAAAAAVTVVAPAGVASAAPPAAPAPPTAAARATATTADAAQRARVAWETHGRPTAMVVVRTTGVDLVEQGRLTRRIPRAGATLTLQALDRYLPGGWLTVTGGTARLNAAVVLTPDVTLDVGAPVTALQLAGGATASDAAALYTGSGTLTLRGVTVTSVDRTSGQVMPPGPGRPFVLVSPGGRLTATDATIGDLGTSPTGADDGPDHPGVDFHPGSTGSLVRTALPRNGTGLVLDGARDVHLEDVTVSDATGAGLVLRGDRGTTLSGVRAEHNGTYGVQVVGPSTDRPVTGITTTGNGTFGLGVDRQTGLQVSGVTTTGDGSGGVDVQQSRSVTITGLATADEPVGVLTHVNSADVVLDRLTSTGGRRGVMVEKTTDGVTVRSSTIAGASVAGVAVGGQNVEVRDVAVTGSRTGMRVERGAHGVTAAALTLSGGQDGLVAGPGTSGVVLQDLTVEGVAGDAVRSSSPDARILGGRIRGGVTGIAVDAPTTITGTSIGLVDEGIRTQSPAPVHADGLDVDAVSVGINAAAGSPVLLTGSHVHALQAVRGTLTEQGSNELSLPSLNLLGAIGIPLVLLALALQAVAALRGRRYGGDARRTAPVLPATAVVDDPTPAADEPAAADPEPTPASPAVDDPAPARRAATEPVTRPRMPRAA
jgi:Right handed beta helix region